MVRNGDAGGTETQDKHNQCEDVAGHVQAQVHRFHRCCPLRVPRLFCDGDEPDVVLDEGESPEDEEDRPMAEDRGDGELAVALQEEEEECHGPGEDSSDQHKDVNTGHRAVVAENLEEEDSDTEEWKEDVDQDLDVEEEGDSGD